MKILQARELQQRIQDEKSWFGQNQIEIPDEFPNIDRSALNSIQELMNDRPPESLVSKAYPVLLTTDIELFTGQNWINYQFIESYSSFINNLNSSCVNYSLIHQTTLESKNFCEK